MFLTSMAFQLVFRSSTACERSPYFDRLLRDNIIYGTRDKARQRIQLQCWYVIVECSYAIYMSIDVRLVQDHKPTLTPWSQIDIWSLGVLLFRM